MWFAVEADAVNSIVQRAQGAYVHIPPEGSFVRVVNLSQFLAAVKKLDLVRVQKTVSDEERLWLVATVLILCEKIGLVDFKNPKAEAGRVREPVPLPKGLVDLLEVCEKQNLITINRNKLRKMTSST